MSLRHGNDQQKDIWEQKGIEDIVWPCVQDAPQLCTLEPLLDRHVNRQRQFFPFTWAIAAAAG